MRIKNQHAKRILWVLVIVIVPSFVLWGSAALRGGKNKEIGKINAKSITRNDFQPYLELASLHWILNPPETSLKRRDVMSLATSLYLLLYQAEKENITVSDKEVVEYIQNIPVFLSDGKFDKNEYRRFINYIQNRYRPGFNARKFEEYVRSILKREKLLDAHVDVDIDEEMVRSMYIRDNQKAKISYLFIPYASLETKIDIPLAGLEEFYDNNMGLFRRKPKIKTAYIQLDPADEKTKEIIERAGNAVRLEELTEEKINTTGFFAKDEPIEDIGFVPKINEILFSLEKGEISSPLKFDTHIFLFQKLEEKGSSTPEFANIKDEVLSVYRRKQAKQQAEEIAANILAKIKSSQNKNLKSYADGKRIQFSQTDFFKYFDYIKGLGLSKKVSQLAFFQLKDKEVFSQPLIREKGIYIVKLEEKTEIDEQEFEKTKPQYYQTIKERKELRGRFDYLSRLRKKLGFSLTLPQ